MKIRRRQRLDGRAAAARVQRRANAIRKQKERARRDARMMAVVQDGDLPYTPDVMSWLSRRLGKPASTIATGDLTTLVS